MPQFLMSGGPGGEGNSAGLIPTAMVSSMFGQMMPGALEKLKEEAPQGGRRTTTARDGLKRPCGAGGLSRSRRRMIVSTFSAGEPDRTRVKTCFPRPG